MKLFVYLLLVVGTFALSFLLTAGMLKIICWVFSIQFSMKIALGIWLIIMLLRSIFGGNK